MKHPTFFRLRQDMFISWLLIAIIIALGFYIALNSTSQKAAPLKQTQKQAAKTLEKQVDSKGAIVIEATPLSLVRGEEVSFQLEFTTHSVELDYELVKISKLKDDKGNAYDALSWSGGKGGHHLSGVLTFPNVSKEAKSLTLVIPNIDSQDRVFIWNF